ncbi:MAG TPA: multicopper oxidase domain-containing protein [Longimicrobiaceae bacterium]|nr:multicopper oxidase domain-containing protein [Longimicrobiaceae bacterium]
MADWIDAGLRPKSPSSRRDFLRKSAVALAVPVAGAALASCTTAESSETGTKASSDVAAHSGGTMAHAPAAAPAAAPTKDWREMDRMHEAGVKAFPAKTALHGNQPLTPKLVNGAKQFELVCQQVKWEVEPGKFVDAMTYNGMVPGPVIRVTEGDRVRVIVRNEMDESTAIHWHGQDVPNAQDGVPFITQPPITPGATFTYEFVATPFGSHMYHSHYNAAEQTLKGMLGAFIVDPKDRSLEPAYDEEWIMILNDMHHGFTINGKGFPATQPLAIKRGKKLRMRVMNEGAMIHPMHLHGMPMTVFARDGYPLPQPFKCDTLNIGPGERWDAIVDCNNPGTWAFHCHILTHAEGPHGMFGMVTALIVE